MQAKHVERQFNNFVQVFITLLVAAIVHNNYQQVDLGFYLHVYVCMLCKSQVSESIYVAQFPLRIEGIGVDNITLGWLFHVYCEFICTLAEVAHVRALN